MCQQCLWWQRILCDIFSVCCVAGGTTRWLLYDVVSRQGPVLWRYCHILWFLLCCPLALQFISLPLLEGVIEVRRPLYRVSIKLLCLQERLHSQFSDIHLWSLPSTFTTGCSSAVVISDFHVFQWRLCLCNISGQHFAQLAGPIWSWKPGRTEKRWPTLWAGCSSRPHRKWRWTKRQWRRSAALPSGCLMGVSTRWRLSSWPSAAPLLSPICPLLPPTGSCENSLPQKFWSFGLEVQPVQKRSTSQHRHPIRVSGYGVSPLTLHDIWHLCCRTESGGVSAASLKTLLIVLSGDSLQDKYTGNLLTVIDWLFILLTDSLTSTIWLIVHLSLIDLGPCSSGECSPGEGMAIRGAWLYQ